MQPISRSMSAVRGHWLYRHAEVEGVIADLAEAGALANTTIVAAPEGCGLGERYAALCSALSIGERIRDQGGHSFVVLDDITCMVGPTKAPVMPLRAMLFGNICMLSS